MMNVDPQGSSRSFDAELSAAETDRHRVLSAPEGA
jgi:hypothetical protein